MDRKTYTLKEVLNMIWNLEDGIEQEIVVIYDTNCKVDTTGYSDYFLRHTSEAQLNRNVLNIAAATITATGTPCIQIQV